MWTRTAITIAVLVYLSVIGLTLVFPELDFKLMLLVIGLVFLGMPHGALDIYLTYKLIKKGQRISTFLGAYLLISAGVIALWTINPTVSFLCFLAYSMFHFADSDLQKPIGLNRVTWLEFGARFPLPLGLPILFHENSTVSLISLVHPLIQFEPFIPYFKFLGAVGLVLTTLFTLFGGFYFFKKSDRRDLTFLEPAVLCVLFSQITPLYALGIYFCFIHSIKHLVNVVTHLNLKSFTRLIPFWLAPLAGVPILFAIYVFGGYRADEFQAHLFQYVIVILSALALPHALLVRYCKITGTID